MPNPPADIVFPTPAGRGCATQPQATIGIMTRAGGGWRPAVLGPYNLLDHGTGVLAVPTRRPGSDAWPVHPQTPSTGATRDR